MSWAGPDDTWLESDMTFATWLSAMATFRHRQVLAEALTPARTVTPEPSKERPYPKKPLKTPRPRMVAEHVPTDTDIFTDQQMTKGAEILARIERRKNA